MCKRRGDNYEMKEVIDLHFFKITNNPTSDKENRKVCTRSHAVFIMIFFFFFKKPVSAKARYLTTPIVEVFLILQMS